MPAEDLANILEQNNGTNFVSLIDAFKNRTDGARFVALVQRAFYGEPDLLYIAIRYAALKNVPLLFAPDDDANYA
ncbi:hypothetical protein HWD35_05885 [Tsukamurella tyrosinosolvens]|uniref:hypothetical protein n=1 Tax=Tsukamurella tyrosinosolvens TaxID=57704 RepID=UPI001CE1E9B9|nr:hypothetical protein [Tsukamurella tyrosinosolvens]MCA4994237.1 hypothetical protein [Tsukamurella tyrosinosolvens]